MKQILSILTVFFSLSSAANNLVVYQLECDHLSNPIGISNLNPRLSWKIGANENNCLQTAYAIRVSTSPDFKMNVVWETGKVNSDQSILIPYKGSKLQSTERYYWQVRIWDNQNKKSEWSETAYWEMGISNKEWIAKWIEPTQDTLPNGPAIYLRKEFTNQKTIKRARAYATAHGIYELFINGQKVGNQLFTPGWTTYHKRLQYQTYDVTSMFKVGENAIGAMLGDGWFKGHMGYKNEWGNYGKKVAFLCQIIIEYTDGTIAKITTDKLWKSTNNGPIILNSIYNGETYNAQNELTNWNSSEFNASNWTNVHEVDYSFNNLISSESVPVKAIQELKPQNIFTTPNGTLVADFGQNMVGRIRLKMRGKTGETITIKHAEVLNKNGEFYTENLRSAAATVNYTFKGNEIEIYEPYFTFMGFRYISVEGYKGELTKENLTGIVIHSDMNERGRFDCSNPLINQLQQNIKWGQKGNFLDIPTDCPQRDERLGWTGDAQVFLRTACYNMDVSSFFFKWLKDLEAEQDMRGAVPFIIPNPSGEVHPSAGWADVTTIAPWTIYRTYGDKEILKNQYSSMKKYVEYIRQTAGANYIWKDGSIFGDWLFFKPELAQWTVPDGHTDHDLIATAFFAYSTQLLIFAAQELDLEEDVQSYSKLLKNIKQAFNDNYTTKTGSMVSHSQTAYVLALAFDLLKEEQKDQAVNNLVSNIQKRQNHLSTGFLGTPYICHVLSENGHTDLAYELLLQETFPSWLYPVKQGATTIWERWDGIKTDGEFQNVSMNSFNHYAYGAIGDWMYRVVAGIQELAPGYKKILIHPHLNTKLQYANATYDSPYGLIKSGWKTEQNSWILNTTIPPNTTAKIVIPESEIGKIKMNQVQLKEATTVDNNIIVEVGAGNYKFEIAN